MMYLYIHIYISFITQVNKSTNGKIHLSHLTEVELGGPDNTLLKSDPKRGNGPRDG